MDVAYQFSFGARQHVGTSAISPEFNGSSMEVMAHWLILGASVSF